MTAARKLWTSEHQRQLRQARLRAGVSDVAFARDNAITLRHLQQLESGDSTAFYSESIKFDTGVKLLRRLGVEPPIVEDAPLATLADTPGVTLAPVTSDVSDEEGTSHATSSGSSGKPTRFPTLLLSLVGVGLIGAGISWIPSIHSPGAVQGVVSSVAPAVAPVMASSTADTGSAGTITSATPQVAEGAATPVLASKPETLPPELCDPAGAVQTIVPSQPSKTADYVYLTAVSEVTLCVRDARGQITRKTLQAGQSFNIPGRQPFDLTADKLHQLRVFFQGQRIWFQADAPRLRLTAATAGD